MVVISLVAALMVLLLVYGAGAGVACGMQCLYRSQKAAWARWLLHLAGYVWITTLLILWLTDTLLGSGALERIELLFCVAYFLCYLSPAVVCFWAMGPALRFRWSPLQTITFGAFGFLPSFLVYSHPEITVNWW